MLLERVHPSRPTVRTLQRRLTFNPAGVFVDRDEASVTTSIVRAGAHIAVVDHEMLQKETLNLFDPSIKLLLLVRRGRLCKIGSLRDKEEGDFRQLKSFARLLGIILSTVLAVSPQFLFLFCFVWLGAHPFGNGALELVTDLGFGPGESTVVADYYLARALIDLLTQFCLTVASFAELLLLQLDILVFILQLTPSFLG